jgi:hypothetical protein
MKLSLFCVGVGVLVCALVGCGSADEAPESVATVSSALDARFNASQPAVTQWDDWSCSVHTTTWMLQATGHALSWTDVKNRMIATGRVSPSWGLSDSSGAGLAQTLRDFDGEPSVGHAAWASFDDIAAKAGQMAVGIGGRGWNHWVAVRGYDASRDVILLANSAPGYRSVWQELDRGAFNRLGSFSMVWMDFGQIDPNVPPDGPFAALLVKAPIGAGQWVTQCTNAGEKVWQTRSTGADPWSRWAGAKYPQNVTASCGTKSNGRYPIVFRSAGAGSFSAWVVECAGTGNQHVYRTETTIEGHPAAVYLYDEPNASCP